MTNKVSAKKIYHIKLGRGDSYSKKSIDKGIIFFSYREISHSICMKGEEAIRKEVRNKLDRKGGSLTRSVNEILKFYNEPQTTMWITFYGGKLYYSFAEKKVKIKKDSEGKFKFRYRKTLDEWKCEDVDGNELLESELHSKLVTKKYYRMTICSVKGDLKKYLLKKINNEESIEQKNIEKVKSPIKKLITRLNPKNFEILCDLILSRSGILRTTQLGGQMKDIDFAGEYPLEKKHIYAQFKMKISKKGFRKQLEIVEEWGNEGSKFLFFIGSEVSSLDNTLTEFKTENEDIDVELYGLDKIANLCFNLGLATWIMDRTT